MQSVGLIEYPSSQAHPWSDNSNFYPRLGSETLAKKSDVAGYPRGKVKLAGSHILLTAIDEGHSRGVTTEPSSPMNLSAASLLSIFLGEATFSSPNFLAATQHQSVLSAQEDVGASACQGALLNSIPAGFDHVSVSFVKDHLAVLPGVWDSGGISRS